LDLVACLVVVAAVVSRGPRRTQDIRFKLDITLTEFYNGATKKLKVKRDVICIECAGRGSKTDGAVVTCDQCRGTGVQVMIRRLGPGMVQQMQTRCDKCNGQKEIIAEKDRCQVCEGKKVVKQEKVLEVFVDRGAKEGQTIKFREAADQAPGAETGDIIVVLAEKKRWG
jgi:DnaJ-class molecular chaperone